MKEWNQYDEFVIDEMADNIVSPGIIQKALEIAGRPINYGFEKMNSSDIKIVRDAAGLIQHKISDVMILTIKGARHLYSEKKIIKRFGKNQVFVTSLDELQTKANLELKDTLAGSTKLVNGVMIFCEGVLAGVGTTLTADTAAIPIMVADVAASMTMLSREAVQIAANYGYPASDNGNIAHILAAMAPIYDENKGFIAFKQTLFQEIRESLAFLEQSSKEISQEVLEKEAPALLRLISNIAERLGVTLSEKELGLLIPVAGAGLNGTLNLAFQRIGHRNAMDYFRFRDLCSRYGEDVVQKRLEALIQSKDN